MPAKLDRRGFLARLLAGTSAALLAGCDDVSAKPWLQNVLGKAEQLNRFVQRTLLPHQALAPEFAKADISPVFKANGSTNPLDADYRQLVTENFANWRLVVDGLVDRPLALSLAELQALPARTQITRHDCVEGWSAIAEWTGVPLAALLERAGVQADARYVLFHCADTMDDGASYYESVALDDAYHPQTILAYAMNGQPLPVAHGAPMRLRVERQLGYKMAKYVMRIELARSFAHLGEGKGGYWEDRGYEWYAGI